MSSSSGRLSSLVHRPPLVRGILCAACLVGGALAGGAVVPVAASAAPSAAAAPAASAAGGLDPSDQQRATSMLPADSVDGAALRAAETRLAPSVAAASLQPVSSGDLSGVDVSSYQHPGGAAITWSAVRSSGVSFAFVKATESTGYTNPYYVADMKAARAAGLSVGGYHFARPAYSATAQADSFAAELREAPGNLPPVLDLEDNGGLGVAALRTWTSTFLARVRSDVGLVPIIYTGPYFWSDYLGGSTAFTAYPLWVAEYTAASAPESVGGWQAWTFWQWSDGAYLSPKAVPGIPATVDRDRFAGSAAQLATVSAGSSGPWLAAVAPPLQGGPLSSLQLNTYIHDLARGSSRAAVAVAIERTTAGVQTEVRAGFERVLGRAADPAGLAAWTQRLRTGGISEPAMVLAMTESTEFAQDAHGSAANLITALYRIDLGRTPAAADITHWSAVLAAGGRDLVARDIGFSREAIDASVEREYTAVLGHVADPAGLASWGTSSLLSGTRWESLIGALYGTTEYATDHDLP